MSASVIQEQAPTLEAPTALTAADRCDRCGAQAYLRAELTDGAPLLFCNHHAGLHEPKLAEMGAKIHDEREKLYAQERKGGPAL